MTAGAAKADPAGAGELADAERPDELLERLDLLRAADELEGDRVAADVGDGCAGFTARDESELESALEAAFDCGRTAVVDVHCDPEEKCFPMVPAGAASVDVIEAPEEAVA